MCDTCGCGDSELVPVHVHENLLAANARDAAHNREHFLETGVFTVNLMGSPGAGKTALLEAIAKRLGGSRLRAVSGDLATDNDGERLRAAGMSARTITTGQACHLDARMVHHSLHDLSFEGAEYLFIENVGNLVCPAIYDLGQAVSVVVLSVTEGEDKPLKYPVMFRVADLVILSKSDLLPHLPQISAERVRANLGRVNSEPKLLSVSATTGEGLDELIAWLGERRATLLAKRNLQGNSAQHHHHRGDVPHHHHAHLHDLAHPHEHTHSHEHPHEHHEHPHGLGPRRHEHND